MPKSGSLDPLASKVTSVPEATLVALAVNDATGRLVGGDRDACPSCEPAVDAVDVAVPRVDAICREGPERRRPAGVLLAVGQIVETQRDVARTSHRQRRCHVTFSLGRIRTLLGVY